jgi:ABC-type transport system involved in cytochrome bd biosynthesis fused ATPase/permease subunit
VGKTGRLQKVDPAVVRVFYTTWLLRLQLVVRTDMNADLKKKLTDAFLALDISKPEDKAIMDLQRTVKFIPTKADNYKEHRSRSQERGPAEVIHGRTHQLQNLTVRHLGARSSSALQAIDLTIEQGEQIA